MHHENDSKGGGGGGGGWMNPKKTLDLPLPKVKTLQGLHTKKIISFLRNSLLYKAKLK